MKFVIFFSLTQPFLDEYTAKQYGGWNSFISGIESGFYIILNHISEILAALIEDNPIADIISNIP